MILVCAELTTETNVTTTEMDEDNMGVTAFITEPFQQDNYSVNLIFTKIQCLT